MSCLCLRKPDGPRNNMKLAHKLNGKHSVASGSLLCHVNQIYYLQSVM